MRATVDALQQSGVPRNRTGSGLRTPDSGLRTPAFTLVEVLVASALALTLLVLAFGGLFTSGRSSVRGLEKLDEISRLSRLGEYLKKPLRFATQVQHERPDDRHQQFRVRYVEELSPVDGTRVEKPAKFTLIGKKGEPKRVEIDLAGRTQVMEFERLEVEMGVAANLVTVFLEGTGKRRLEVSVASPYLIALSELSPGAFGSGPPGSVPPVGSGLPAGAWAGGFPPGPASSDGPGADPASEFGAATPPGQGPGSGADGRAVREEGGPGELESPAPKPVPGGSGPPPVAAGRAVLPPSRTGSNTGQLEPGSADKMPPRTGAAPASVRGPSGAPPLVPPVPGDSEPDVETADEQGNTLQRSPPLPGVKGTKPVIRANQQTARSIEPPPPPADSDREIDKELKPRDQKPPADKPGRPLARKRPRVPTAKVKELTDKVGDKESEAARRARRLTEKLPSADNAGALDRPF